MDNGKAPPWDLADSVIVGFYTHSLALVADAFHYVRGQPTTKVVNADGLS
jgi:hypothetical protein